MDSAELARRITGAIVDAGSMRLRATVDGQVLDVDISYAAGAAALRLPNPLDAASDLLIVDGMVYLGGGTGATSWTSFPLASTNPNVAPVAERARLIAERATLDGLTAAITRGSVGEVSREGGLTAYDIAYAAGQGERTKLTVDADWHVHTVDLAGSPPISLVIADYGVVGPILAPPAAEVVPLS